MSRQLKNNILAKIICVSAVFFLKLIYILSLYLLGLITQSKDFLSYLLIILYNFGEERLINNRKKEINFPFHFGLVLTKENFNQNFLKNFLKIIHWTILFDDITLLNIYDPFKIIDEKNETILLNSLSQVFNKNFSILVITKNKIFDCKTREEKKKEESFISTGDGEKVKKYDLIISFVSFESANKNLIEKTYCNYTNEIVLPEELSCLFPIEAKCKNAEENSNYEMFFTKKFAKYLPEVVLFMGCEEICLFGYPFVLLENTEIIKAGKVTSINVIKFLEIFEKYSQINKRFGK